MAKPLTQQVSSTLCEIYSLNKSRRSESLELGWDKEEKDYGSQLMGWKQYQQNSECAPPNPKLIQMASHHLA